MEVLIVKTGRAVEPVRERTGEDFEDWFRRGLGLTAAQAPCIDVSAVADARAALPDPAGVTAVVVTGSPAMLTDEPAWSTATAQWLREAIDAGAAVLGVCYGHQLLAVALGGRVGDNPRGREIGTVTVHADPGAAFMDPLFSRLFVEMRSGVLDDGRTPIYPRDDGSLAVLDGEPDEFRFVAHATHSQCVLVPPPGARILARNAVDGCQAFAWGSRVWGVQFHPEFDAAILAGYVDARSGDLAAEGIDAAAVRAGIRDSVFGTRLLRAFLAIASHGPSNGVNATDHEIPSGLPADPEALLRVSGLPQSLVEAAADQLRAVVIDAFSLRVTRRKHVKRLRKLVDALSDFLLPATAQELRVQLNAIEQDVRWRKSKHGRFVLEVNAWAMTFRDEFRSVADYRDVLVGAHSDRRRVLVAGRVADGATAERLLEFVRSKNPPGKVVSRVVVDKVGGVANGGKKAKAAGTKPVDAKAAKAAKPTNTVKTDDRTPSGS